MKAFRRIAAFLVPVVLTACATPSPEIKSVVAAQPGDPSKALLDLRGLSGVQAYEGGVQLDSNAALPPGRHTLHFSFDAVYAQAYRCMPPRWTGADTVKLIFNPIAIIGLPVAAAFAGAQALTCQAASSALEKSRACYTLSLDAKPGDVYVPRAVGNKPALIESRSGATVATGQPVACATLDKLSASRQAERAHRAEEARRQAEMERMKRAKAAPKRAGANAKRAEEKHRGQAARPKARTVDKSGTLVAKRERESTASTGSGHALKALFSGARVYLNRAGQWGEVNYVLEFHANGAVSGNGTDNKGILETIHASGRWWIRSSQLCTQLTVDTNKKECYVIAGKDGHYSASGAAGLLAGQFQLTR